MSIAGGHLWDVTPREAARIQRELAPRVLRQDRLSEVRYIAGTDVAAGSRFQPDRPGRAAVVVLRWPELEPVEQVVLQTEVRFPYIPGLLSFREIPVLLPALSRLRHTPDLLVVDGQGIAHPRRLGLASHLGVLLDLPAIGCAKSRLTGEIAGDLDEERGARVALMDGDERIGCALRTRAGTKPLYVSPGHRVSMDTAADWVVALAKGYRLPEPTRLAHLAAAGREVAPATAS